MPSGPGVITLNMAREIARATPPGVSSFLLTSSTKTAAIISELQYTGVNVVQLVDEVSPEVYAAIRSALPNVRIVQVIHVLGETDIQLAQNLATQVDALLLDSGNPNLPIKELGGTGRTHNWQISRRIVEAVAVPVFLAGGIHEMNVKQAIECVRPYGIDLCSSVRTLGKLDPKKLDSLTCAMGLH